MRLRSRLERPGRSQTSPKRTFSVRSMSFGTTARSFSRTADADDDAVAIGSSFLLCPIDNGISRYHSLIFKVVFRSSRKSAKLRSLDGSHNIMDNHTGYNRMT